jgi:HD-GYP domain-containing protein (c-di-GMP phosphodiesterase class II)
MDMEINLREFIYALSDSLDFVGVDDIFHGKRVGYMAAQCAKSMGYSDSQVSDIIEMGLLHDCGVSNTGVHERLVMEFHWESSQEHCIRGRDLLQLSSLLSKYSTVIEYHHTKWCELKDKDIDEETKRLANLIFMTDRVDALNAKYATLDVHSKMKYIHDEMRRKVDFFATDLLEVFLDVSSKEAFWYGLDNNAINEYLEEWKNEIKPTKYSYTSIKELVKLFSYIVDFKSPFTAEHSLGVALVAKEIATQMNLADDTIKKIELSGYLHDLGKLRVPDTILDKPDKLNDYELAVINRHSFDTYYILRKISGFEDIAKWAGLHHEKLDGHGYPFGSEEKDIPIEAKVITIADIFQALIQDRPYRGTLSKEKVLAIFDDMLAKHEIDKDIFALVQDRVDYYYDLALNPHNYDKE